MKGGFEELAQQAKELVGKFDSAIEAESDEKVRVLLQTLRGSLSAIELSAWSLVAMRQQGKPPHGAN